MTVTPNDGGAGGTFTPASVVLDTSTPSAEFAYSPASAGNKIISVTNDGAYKDPAAISYNATPFDPSTIAGLQGWWKADAITGLADGAPLVTWPDSSGHGYTITGGCAAISGAAPIYRATGFNGKPCIDFPTLGYACDIANGGVAVTEPWTEFVVMKGTAGQPFYALNISSGYGSMGLSLSNDDHCYFGGSGNRFTAGTVGVAPHVATAISDAAARRCWIDGNEFATTLVGSGPDYVPGFDRFGAFAGGNFGVGLVAEILHYNVALSDADRQKVQNYLKAKYVITFPPPFVPTQIAGCKGWWSADSLALADGAPVTSLPDLSGNNNHATQTGAACPIFKASVIVRSQPPEIAEGKPTPDDPEISQPKVPTLRDMVDLQLVNKPVIRFASTPTLQRLDLTTPIPDTTWTVIAVLRQTVSGTLSVSLGSLGGYGTVGPYVYPNNWQIGAHGTGYTSDNCDNAFHVMSGDTTPSLYKEGVALTLTSPVGYGGGNLDCIGQRYAQGSDGDVAEIIAYDSVLSVADRTKVESYLRLKYGI